MSIAQDYWTQLYANNMEACVHRIKTLGEDFLATIDDHPTVKNVISNSKTILEFGCGTGDLIKLLSHRNPFALYVGVDISTAAIDYARLHNRLFNQIYYFNSDILTENFPGCDLTITSNTLEHFKDPYVIIDKLLKTGKKLLILCPYNEQDLKDGYDSEGGAGHVFSFTEKSFERYEILDWYTFRTDEWAMPPDPKQLVILIK
jgi:SAM-dependent methyltransferase